MNFKTIMIALLGLTLSTVAYAAPEQDKAAQLEQSHVLEKNALDFNQKLGTKLVTSINWKSFKSSHLKTHSIGTYCSTPLEALTSMTKGPKAKQYVKKHLTKFVCSYRGSSKTQMKMKGKTMTWFVNFDVSDSRQSVLKNF